MVCFVLLKWKALGVKNSNWWNKKESWRQKIKRYGNTGQYVWTASQDKKIVASIYVINETSKHVDQRKKKAYFNRTFLSYTGPVLSSYNRFPIKIDSQSNRGLMVSSIEARHIISSFRSFKSKMPLRHIVRIVIGIPVCRCHLNHTNQIKVHLFDQMKLINLIKVTHATQKSSSSARNRSMNLWKSLFSKKKPLKILISHIPLLLMCPNTFKENWALIKIHNFVVDLDKMQENETYFH